MAVVWVPALMRSMTGGREMVTVSGSTVREIIDSLEKQHPGFKGYVMEDDHLNPGVSVVIDGAMVSTDLMEQVEENSEVVFLPAVSGGRQQ